MPRTTRTTRKKRRPEPSCTAVTLRMALHYRSRRGHYSPSRAVSLGDELVAPGVVAAGGTLDDRDAHGAALIAWCGFGTASPGDHDARIALAETHGLGRRDGASGRVRLVIDECVEIEARARGGEREADGETFPRFERLVLRDANADPFRARTGRRHGTARAVAAHRPDGARFGAEVRQR